ILITDHNVRETLQIVDRASIMFDGEVLFEGTPNEVLSDRTVRERYLGNSFN
ncbi:MAG: LPS export ABC transporter ATP-binding protein, partial [Terricaulis sp.]